AHYKKVFCEDRIDAFDTMNELPKSINIKDAINFMSTAWENVTKETIRNCWMKTSILPEGFLDEYLNDDSEPAVVDVIGEIQDLIEQLPLDQPMDAEEYMVIDDNVIAREIPTDEEIISIVKNCESNESDDGDLETEPLSYAQAITFVDGI
ncbi:1970_t:CDS:1, partial [Paraglomus occultum]